MKTFYVLWTYVASYSRLMSVQAENAEEAAKLACGYFDENFHKKATVYVFNVPPAMIVHRGEDKTGCNSMFEHTCIPDCDSAFWYSEYGKAACTCEESREASETLTDPQHYDSCAIMQAYRIWSLSRLVG